MEALEIQETQTKDSGTNCVDCEKYKTLGEVCVIEHGKTFLWEFCRDFQPEVKLPDYNELMRTVKREIALERRKTKEKKRRERLLRRKQKGEMLKAKKRAKRAALMKKSVEKGPLSGKTKSLKRISVIKPMDKSKQKSLKMSASDSDTSYRGISSEELELQRTQGRNANNSNSSSGRTRRRIATRTIKSSHDLEPSTESTLPSIRTKTPTSMGEEKISTSTIPKGRNQAKTPRTASSARATA